MNSHDQISTPKANGASLEAPIAAPQPATAFAYRGNGKVARLPKPIRDQLNHWMLDGVSYPGIIRRLGEHGKDFKPAHLHEWKKRGHQDWLLQQDWLAERRARQESATDLIQDSDTTQVNQGALHLGTLYIFEALRDLRAGSLDDKLGGDSLAFARLLNALSRASRETLQLQKYRDVIARAQAALQELKDPKRKLNESENRALVRKVDDILGLHPDPSEDPSAQPAKPEPDNPTPAQNTDN